jgi:hypothetical protein
MFLGKSCQGVDGVGGDRHPEFNIRGPEPVVTRNGPLNQFEPVMIGKQGPSLFEWVLITGTIQYVFAIVLALLVRSTESMRRIQLDKTPRKLNADHRKRRGGSRFGFV